MVRFGAIDIGSNAIRLLIADVIENKNSVTFKKNTLIRVPIRLGEDVFMHETIRPEKAEDLVKAMGAFKNLMDVYKVTDYMACATSAMREAANGAELVQQIAAVGIDLQIIDGSTEANIIYSSYVEELLEDKSNYLYIDVGGGSTELSVFAEGEFVDSKSFNIGTIRILDGKDKEEDWDAMRDWIKSYTKKYKNLIGIGTGGNINKLYRLSSVKNGKPMSYLKLRAQYNYLNSFTLEERIEDLKLKSDRADVIIPACTIFISVMKWAGAKQILVPQVGLADGIIQKLIDQNYHNH